MNYPFSFKVILVVTLTIFSQLFSQAYNRFIYRYEVAEDSANAGSRLQKMMFLDVSEDGSVFYNNEKYETDSVLALAGENSSRTEDIVIKKYPDYSVSLITRLLENTYSVSDPVKQDWNIKGEKSTVLDYAVQKAELDFAGRKWTAWFATEIPIQEGPYKFHDLPGLIMKIEDDSGSHFFELIGIKNAYYKRSFNFSKAVAVDRKKFKKLLKEYRENPAKNIIGSEVTNTQDGISGNEFQRKMSEYMKRQVSRKNNILEIDLLKEKAP